MSAMFSPNRLSAYASQPHAELALFAIAALEGAFMPFPTEMLLIPMVLLSPNHAFRYALIATSGSISGAFFGYFAGYSLMKIIGLQFFGAYGLLPFILFVKGLFTGYTSIFVLSAGFSTIPYKIVTFLCGFFEAGLPQFLVASAVSRGARFFLIAWLLWRSGPRVQQWLHRYFHGLSLAMSLGFILTFSILIFLLKT